MSIPLLLNMYVYLSLIIKLTILTSLKDYITILIIIIVARLRLDLFKKKKKYWCEKTFLKGSEQMVTKHPVQL